MLNHIIYNEIASQINRSLCAYLPREDVKRHVLLIMAQITATKSLDLPAWEQQAVARQLVHDLPNLDHPFAA